jgi:hypothetical protein
MADDIPREIRAYLDEVAQILRERNDGKSIPGAWTRYLLQALRKPTARKRGRPSHPDRKIIMNRLLKAKFSEKRGALEHALNEASGAHGVDKRTLEKWVAWPRLTAGEYVSAPSRDLIEAMAAFIAEEVIAELEAENADPPSVPLPPPPDRTPK